MTGDRKRKTARSAASGHPSPVTRHLLRGLVIPAHPLALTRARKLDERHQRALTRYYLAAGAGGVAVGVHTTQFAIRDVGLYAPVLELAAEEVARFEGRRRRRIVKVAGVVGRTSQALREARQAADLGYHTALLSLAALRDATNDQLIAHARAVAEVMPVFGFYLQPAVGGRVLDADFWRRFCEIERVVAIKVAPFDRYRTLDVMRAVAESGRRDIALYTGNDDNILMDLLTPYRGTGARGHGGTTARSPVTRHRSSVHRPLSTVHFCGGLLGHWAVWTRTAVKHHALCRRLARSGRAVPRRVLRLAAQVTGANAAVFDAANGFKGCIAGIHEVLRGQGLMAGNWCLDQREGLSPGQSRSIALVRERYPHLTDDDFVERNRDRWLR